MTTKYRITASGVDYWLNCTAKTLKGAKAAASKAFTRSVGHKLIVGVVLNEGLPEFEHVVPVAVVYGHDKKWSNL